MIDKKYPSYWPCINCSRPFSVHLKIGPTKKAYVPSLGLIPHNTENWCYPETIGDRKKYPLYFIPADNLTYIEMIAKNKRDKQIKPRKIGKQKKEINRKK